MSKVYLSGYYGMSNSGDDALLAASIWGINKFIRDCSGIYLTAPFLSDLSLNNIQIMPIRKPVTRFVGENGLRDLLYASFANIIIYGGGSVFHNAYYMLKQIYLMKSMRRGPRLAMGVSVGPFNSAFDEKVCSMLLKKFDFVGVRDQQSYEIARSISPHTPIFKTFDLAVLFPKLYNVDTRQLTSMLKSGIGIAMCSTNISQKTQNALVELINKLARLGHTDITLIDFNGNNRNGDVAINNYIQSNVNTEVNIRRIPYCSSPLIVLECISKLKVVIAMRLHAAVFAYMAQTPVILLSYHDKCRNWAIEIGMNKKYMYESNCMDLEAIVTITDTVLSQGYIFPDLDLASAEKRSLDNWRYFQ